MQEHLSLHRNEAGESNGNHLSSVPEDIYPEGTAESHGEKTVEM